MTDRRASRFLPSWLGSRPPRAARPYVDPELESHSNVSPRSLVIAPQWIGDAVMTEPMVSRLVNRGETVTVAALPWIAPVYRAMPHDIGVIELPFAHRRLDWGARRRIAATLHGRFENAYVLPNSIKSALLPWMARIPRRIGYQGEGRPLLLTRRHANPGGKPPMVDFYSALAGPVDAPGAHPRLQLNAALRSRVLARHGLSRRGYWVFAPGAEYGPAKRWPPGHYAALARQLHDRDGRPVLLLGSGKERALADEIAQAVPGACRVMAGGTSLLDAFALIASARGVVSNDSGLMHVAAAFEVPQVAVFGSTSPQHTPPLNRHARVLWLKDELGLDCMPCFERNCRFGHYLCLKSVTPERADTALHDALSD